MKFRNILIALAVAVGFTACSDDDYVPEGLGDKLTVRENIALSADNAYTLNIRCSSAPTLSTDADWLHVSPAVLYAGTNNTYSAIVQADLNPNAEPRTANITVVAGNETAVVKVTHNSGEVVSILSVDPEGDLYPDGGRILNPNGGSISIKYSSTSPVTVTVPAWMSAADDAEASVVTVTYLANGDEDRTGEIVLAINEQVKATLTVRQAKAEKLAGRTATQIVADMYAGINIGNTLEAPGSETGWVKTLINQDYIRGLKQLGFNAVRIPCAWDSHVSDAASNTIDPAWLARVDEVVGYIVGNGMYAVLNSHWDNGWLEKSFVNGYSEEVNKKQHDYWKQIAEQLNHYDQHLLFASMNEPDASNNAAIDIMMQYHQTMIDVVRATGGNNADRVIVIQGPLTNIDATTAGHFKMPNDNIADRLAVEVHYYDPYQFNMMTEDATWGKMHYYWGANNLVSGSDRNSTHSENDVRTQMQKVKAAFVDKGIPGILGEYAVCAVRYNYSDIDRDKWCASVRDWNIAVTREAKNAGLAPFFWEISEDINRLNGTIRRTYVIDGVFDGAAAGKYPF